MTGWFADIDSEGAETASEFPWQPVLKYDEAGSVTSVEIWFRTKEECEKFIREHILGQGEFLD